MPKRLVDGEKMWRSDKLKRVQPESFRAEYANLLPLALANGSFECDPARIWAEVYSFNRPTMQLADVERLLEALESVKLLFRWREPDNKVWGYWIGIDKNGLLPSKSSVKLKRYRVGKRPPKELLTRFLNNEIQSGLVSQQYQDTVMSNPAGFGVGLV